MGSVGWGRLEREEGEGGRGREGGKEGGREGGRKAGREGGREGGREKAIETNKMMLETTNSESSHLGTTLRLRWST